MTEPRVSQSVPFRGGGFSPRPRVLFGLAVMVILITVWETGCRTGIIHPLVLPAPSEAATAFMELFESGMLWKHLGASLSRLVIGWTAGTILGITVGFAIGLF
ncbi:MAG: ABC transporter permease, partial [Nisaea sp.]